MIDCSPHGDLDIKMNNLTNPQNYTFLATGVFIGVTFSVFLSFLQNKNYRKHVEPASSSLIDRLEAAKGLGTKQIWDEDNKYNGAVYFDYNASTPVFPEVTLAMIPYITTCFGNPSSPHVFAKPCREAIDNARNLVAQLVGATSDTIYFTSCGTECDNRAIDIALHHFHRLNGDTIIANVITCSIEHPAILLYLKQLEERKAITITMVDVDSEGVVNPGQIESALQTNTALVTIMHSNNEVGSMQPIRDISKRIETYNAANKTQVLFHTDGAQSIGKVPVDVIALNVDFFSIVGHKYGAPKGVAALYIRNNVQCCPMLVGGGQERGLRSGTENVPLIVALGEASRVARCEAEAMLVHLLSLKLRLVVGLRKLEEKYPEILRFNGPVRSCTPTDITTELSMLKMIFGDSKRKNNMSGNSQSMLVEQLPNTVNVSFRDTCSQELMTILADKVACSAGSACHSKAGSLSGVLAAMKVDPAYGLCTLRLSFGRHTSEEDVDKAVRDISNAIISLKK